MALTAKQRALLAQRVISVADYPVKGISFKDVTPLLSDKKTLAAAVKALADFAGPLKPDLIVSPEARGFMFGSALAVLLGCGFVPARKPDKLPRKSVSCSYEMEYGKNSLSIHEDSVLPNQRVLVVDDLLASGGTAYACTELVKKLGGKPVGYAFVIVLAEMQGEKRLEAKVPIYSCLTY